MAETTNHGEDSRALTPTSPLPFRNIPRRGAPGTSTESQQAFTLWTVLNALRQWWKVAVPIGLLLATVAGTIVYVLFEPKYEAAAWIQIHYRAPYLAFEPESSRDGLDRFVRTEMALIRSPLVLGPVVTQSAISQLPEIREQEDPIKWLSQRIAIRSVEKSELFTILFSSDVPEIAMQVVNAVADAYFELRNQDAAGRVHRVVQLLDEERASRFREVERLQEDVRELTKQAMKDRPYADMTDSGFLVRHPLSGLQDRLVTEEVELQVLEARLKALEESKLATTVPSEVVEQSIQENRAVQSLTEQILTIRAELYETERRVANTGQDRRCKKLKDDIKQLEWSLEQYQNELRPNVLDQLQKRYQGEIEKLKESNSGDRDLDVEFKKQELVRAEDVHQRISGRIIALRTEQRAPDRVMLLKRADLPRKPVRVFPAKEMALAVLVGLCLPFLLAVAWERNVHRISDLEYLERNLDLNVIGEITRLPTRSIVLEPSRAKRFKGDLRLFEESIDTLRTSLVLSDELKNIKVLAVTSAVNNEGKTSVAAQLAVSIARATGELTLLVDGDIRFPDVHKIFEISLGPGLAQLLSHECTLEEAIVPDENRKMHLLPAGRFKGSPHKLFGNGAVKLLLDQVSSRYHFIIIDTPPVLAASESLVVSKAADAALICVMRDVSRIDQVQKAYGRLLATGSRPVGTVLSGITARRYVDRYGTYSFSDG
jgi:capsular exopolysaccharide synthesis family protein